MTKEKRSEHMVIVYISLAVLAISIIFLGFNVIQNKKK